MDPKQLQLALGSLDPNHQFWKAVQVMLDDSVLAEQDMTVLPNLTDAARHFNAGRLAHARDFAETLKAAVAEAMSD